MNYFVLPGLPKQQTKLSVEEVLVLVAEVTGISTELMTTRTRKREVVEAKQLTAHILDTKLKTSISDIARTLYPYAQHRGNRNSVHNLLSTHADLMETGTTYRNLVNKALIEYDRRVYNAAHESQRPR